MKVRSRIVFVILLLAVLGGGITWLAVRSHEKEPVYQGKPLHV